MKMANPGMDLWMHLVWFKCVKFEGLHACFNQTNCISTPIMTSTMIFMMLICSRCKIELLTQQMAKWRLMSRHCWCCCLLHFHANQKHRYMLIEVLWRSDEHNWGKWAHCGTCSWSVNIVEYTIIHMYRETCHIRPFRNMSWSKLSACQGFDLLILHHS